LPNEVNGFVGFFCFQNLKVGIKVRIFWLSPRGFTSENTGISGRF
jgi:hypothetical protein